MKRRRWITLLFSGMLACMAGWRAWALEVPLKFVKAPEFNRDIDREFFPYSMSYVIGTPETAKRLGEGWKFPKLVSKEPIYHRAEIAGQTFLMIFDHKDKQDTHYTRLYFDANGNRDLTDDPPIDGVHAKKGGWSPQGNDYPVVECTIKAGGKARPYAFQPVLQQIEMWAQHHYVMIGMGRACWYAGRCELGGKRYRISLYDSGSDGTFDEFCSLPKSDFGDNDRIYPGGDTMFIMDEDGQGGWSESVPLCKAVCAGGKVYEVAVDMDAPKLTLTESKAALASVPLPGTIKQLALLSEDGKGSLAAVQPGERVNLPLGRYRLMAYSGKFPDSKGNTWSIEAGATPRTPVTAVTETPGENIFKMGEPFTARGCVPGWMLSNLKNGMPMPDEINIECAVWDQGGRKIGNLSAEPVKRPDAFEASKSRGDLPKEPTYKIRDGKGKTVASGAMEYG